MNGKNDISGRKKSIVIVDKKGNAEKVLKKMNVIDKVNETNSTIKEEVKGEESIKRCETSHAMGKKDKKCECEMCAEKNKKCETCQQRDCCDCKEKSNGESKDQDNKVVEHEAMKGEVINLKMNKTHDTKSQSESTQDQSVSTSKNEVVTAGGAKAEASTSVLSNKGDNSVLSNKGDNSAASNKAEASTSVLSNKGDNNISSNKGNNSAASNKASTSTASNKDSKAEDSKEAIADHQPTDNKPPTAAAITLGKSAQEEKEQQKDGKPQGEKNVTIDEGQNQEFSVTKDSNKSLPLSEGEGPNTKAPENPLKMDGAFVPPRIPSDQLAVESEIRTERNNGNVACEGHIWKRRRIFACFWHEKYFVLTKTGVLKYHKANGTKYPKGNWDLGKFNRIHEIFLGTESHPYRLALVSEDENLLFGFDDPDTREFWYNQFTKFIDL